MNCVLLLSGGLDSAVLLYHLRAAGHGVRCLTVDYGQRHAREVEAAERLAVEAGAEWTFAPLGCPHLLRGSALTGGKPLPQGVPADAREQAATVVPGRNLLLLALAGAYAVSTDASHVAYAATGSDFAVYADCRPLFVEAAATALWRGYGVKVEAPFLDWDKARVVQRGRELGVPFELTYSCYLGEEVPCGTCAACLARGAALGDFAARG